MSGLDGWGNEKYDESKEHFDGKKIPGSADLHQLLIGVMPMGNSVSGTAEGGTGATGNLTFTVSSDMLNQLPEGSSVVFTLYKIGIPMPTNASGWQVDDAFADAGILNATTSEELEGIAETVYAKLRTIPEYAQNGIDVELDADGIGKVTVEVGIYLGALTSQIVGLSSNLFIITVPTIINGVIKSDYDITTKLSYVPPTVPPSESPSPSPSESPSPSPSESPSPSPEESEAPSPSPEESEVPSPSPSAEPSEAPSEAPSNPPRSETPDVTPVPTDTPEPTPTPTPVVDVPVSKTWNDNDNEFGVRPSSITVTLYGNGRPVGTATLRSGSWSYVFTDLPAVDENGNSIRYTVSESPVQYYSSSVSGTTLVNTIIPQEPEEYVDFTGNKTWNDNNNADGSRPNVITVTLYRNGQVYQTRSVSAGTGWSYIFNHLPADDGYGHKYIYEVRENGVPGYFSTSGGGSFVNTRLPSPPTPNSPDEPRVPGPEIENLTEEEMEDLLDLFGYGTPLFGRPLGTGDDTPIYPFIFAGIGVIAVVILLVFGRKRKGNEVK